MANVSGTLRKLTLDGVSYVVMADINLNEIRGQFENDSIATSGEAVQKKIRRVQIRENVDVKANGDEASRLEDLNDRVGSYPMSYTDAAGDTYRTTGFLSIEGRETESNKMTLKLHPTDKAGWTAFIA